MDDKNANYNEDTLNIVYDVVAKFSGVNKATLTPDTALEALDLTLEDYHEIYREACVRASWRESQSDYQFHACLRVVGF